MDAPTVAGATLSFLAPYLSMGGEAFAKKMGEGVAARITKLLGLIKRILSDQESQEDLDNFCKSPGDSHTQTKLRMRLKKALESDQIFTGRLRDLIAEIEANDGDQLRQEVNVTGDNNSVVQIGRGSGNTINT